MNQDRPYPGVRKHGRRWLTTTSAGKNYAASFDTPETARIAALEFQAEAHESIAAERRAEADRLRRGQEG